MADKMTPSPNYIYFYVHWQILGPDSPGQRFERGKFEELQHKINANREFDGYDDFTYRPNRCELAKPRETMAKGGQSFSKLVYSLEPSDSLILVEEWTHYSVPEFAAKVKTVLDSWFSCFPETLAVAQTCVVRALTDPRHFDDTRTFLGEKVLRLEGAFQNKFSEMPHQVGFTFACGKKQAGIPLNIDCVVKSWRDPRSVWIEVRALALLPNPLNLAKHDQGEAVFGRCTSFLETEVIPLLDMYDHPNTQNGGEEKS